MVQLNVISSSGSCICLNVVRVGPQIFTNPFGVLSIRVDSRHLPWYFRYSTDHHVNKATIIFPSWLYDLLECPLTAELEQVSDSVIPIVKYLKLKPLFWTLSTCISEGEMKILKSQTMNQIVSNSSIIPVYIYGKLLYFSCQPELEAECGRIDPTITIIEVELSKGEEAFGDQSTSLTLANEKLENAFVSLEKCNSANYFPTSVPKVFIVKGLDGWLEGRLILLLSNRYTVLDPPISLMLDNVELESFDVEGEGRLEMLKTWAHENLSSENFKVVYFKNVEVLSKKSQSIIGNLVEEWSGYNCGYILFCSEFSPSTSSPPPLFSLLPQLSIINAELSKSEILFGAEASFLNLYHVEGLGMDLQHSLDAISSSKRVNDYGKLGGSLMPKGLSSWDEIYGYDSVKARIKNLIYNNSMIEGVKLGRQLGLSPIKGILLYGPSGCGKTEMVKAIANDGTIPVIQLRPTDILSKYLGETEEKLRAVFSKARELRPCILYIDNIEVLGGKRQKGNTDTVGVSERLLSTILNEMDGIIESIGILIIGCTNRPEELDEALLRPGRLDHHIKVDLPDLLDLHAIIRAQFLRLHIREDPGVLERLKELTLGMSGGSIRNIFNEFGIRNLKNEELPLEGEALEIFVKAKCEK